MKIQIIHKMYKITNNYEARFKSFFVIISAFVITIDKAQGQILIDGVILALVYRNGIYRFINYEKLFIVLTRIKKKYLRFLADTYNDLYYFTKLKPKEYIDVFIEIMKQKQQI